jgi:hypothetical protein
MRYVTLSLTRYQPFFCPRTAPHAYDYSSLQDGGRKSKVFNLSKIKNQKSKIKNQKSVVFFTNLTPQVCE